jgi:hypothetical protein
MNKKPIFRIAIKAIQMIWLRTRKYLNEVSRLTIPLLNACDKIHLAFHNRLKQYRNRNKNIFPYIPFRDLICLICPCIKEYIHSRLNESLNIWVQELNSFHRSTILGGLRLSAVYKSRLILGFLRSRNMMYIFS